MAESFTDRLERIDGAAYISDPLGVDESAILDIGDYCFVSWNGSLNPNPKENNGIGLLDWVTRNFDLRLRVAETLDGQDQCDLQEGM